MTPKIENRSYSYQGDNVCCISATLNIYDLDVIIASTGVSASYNLSQPDFVAEITRQLQTQIISYLNKLGELDVMRANLMPASTSFAHAIDLIIDPIQTAIGG
jgi:hypothetical protein